MMTSVSTSFPYFHAFPLSSISVRSSRIYAVWLLEFVGAADAAQHRRRGGDHRVGEVDLALGVPHPADEVAVRGRDRALALGQDAHVAAQARAAGRRREHRARVDEDVDQP